MLLVNKQCLDMLAHTQVYNPQVGVRITGEKVRFCQFPKEVSVLRMRSAASYYRRLALKGGASEMLCRAEKCTTKTKDR